MREILFKAKRLDNRNWVEGNVFFGENKKCEICIGTPIIRITYEVDPATVCQYTGLTDKNGVKVFDGDIIDFSNGCENKSFYRMYWSNDYCCCYIFGKDGQKHDIIQERMKHCVVVGNIHDKE